MTMPIIIMLLIFLSGVYAVSLWFMRSGYERTIKVLSEDNRDLRDRFYVAKGLPPANIDMVARHEQQEERKEQAKRERKLFNRDGPITGERHRAVLKEMQDIQAGRAPQSLLN